mmetsp:Transcript_138160/g.244079  ORF Transcript_138160/g.244079 Transcript_138160/m.244079 type:complete len:204 (+) Transcript_138160:277-888(+)
MSATLCGADSGEGRVAPDVAGSGAAPGAAQCWTPVALNGAGALASVTLPGASTVATLLLSEAAVLPRELPASTGAAPEAPAPGTPYVLRTEDVIIAACCGSAGESTLRRGDVTACARRPGLSVPGGPAARITFGTMGTAAVMPPPAATTWLGSGAAATDVPGAPTIPGGVGARPHGAKGTCLDSGGVRDGGGAPDFFAARLAD